MFTIDNSLLYQCVVIKLLEIFKINLASNFVGDSTKINDLLIKTDRNFIVLDSF